MVREVASAKRRSAIHERWAKQIVANPPKGVPTEPRNTAVGLAAWPVTAGVYVDGKPEHRVDGDGQEYVFQCLHCRYYDPLESALGADWGACTNAASQYDRQVVFEHWTCKEYESDG